MKNNVDLNQISEYKAAKVLKDILVLVLFLVGLIILPMAFDNTQSVHYKQLVVFTDVMSVVISIMIIYFLQNLSKLLGIDLN